MTYRHGGNLTELARMAGVAATEIIDFSANINPLGPPEYLAGLINRHLRALLSYPDPESGELVAKIAAFWGCTPEQVVVTNGSSEFLYTLFSVCAPKRVLVPVPSYVDYALAVERSGAESVPFYLLAEHEFAPDWAALSAAVPGCEMVILGQPNNPTGRLLERTQLAALVAKHPGVLFVIDEAFADFVPGYDSAKREPPGNVVVMRSLTKFYAIPGLRLGYGVLPAQLAQQVRAALPPWTVNALAQVVGPRLLDDEQYRAQTLAEVALLRDQLYSGLQAIAGLRPGPGVANYLLVQVVAPGHDGASLAQALLKERIAIRVCGNYKGLDRSYIRLAVRGRADNQLLLAALARYFGVGRGAPRQRPTPAIMFQGTSSNAGKSVLTAAFCRILLQDGLQVAPFKAQNMSLNSFVTASGGEIGRAQALQAQAARIAPDVRMNPVLLKPNSERGSQVIVRGQVVKNMTIGEYIDYKPQAFATACACYDELSAENDVLVLEGAGSPGEVNLKQHDIVNMNMARYAQAPVLLVGDIDRGGVFAAFVGTMAVLNFAEQDMVAGFLVNRFRGDPSLLKSAYDYVFDYTGKKVVGTVPYLPNLGLPEEDSVTFKDEVGRNAPVGDAAVDIVALDLPHISNFTDLDALRVEPDLALRVVRQVADLGTPDAIIIPGSKSVAADLKYLEQSGWKQALLQLAATGQVVIVGICGGFQLLGRQIADRYGIEGDPATHAALGLLAITTELAPEKTLCRSQGVCCRSGATVTGYQIHHGISQGEGLSVLVEGPGGEALALGRADETVWGTYLHGIFDSDDFRRAFLDRLRARKGLPPPDLPRAVYDIEPALDRLAAVVRAGVDMDELYRTMGL